MRGAQLQLEYGFAGCAFTGKQRRLSQWQAIENRPLSCWHLLTVPLGHVDERHFRLGRFGLGARDSAGDFVIALLPAAVVRSRGGANDSAQQIDGSAI